MPLTKDYILEKCRYTSWAFEFTEYSPLFDKDVRISVYSSNNDKTTEITDHIVARINSFLQVPASEMAVIKKQVWDHYERCVADAEYSIVPDALYEKHQTAEAANREHFGYQNQEDAYRDAIVDCVYFDDTIDDDHLYCMVCFKTPWEEEHGINLFFQDSLFVNAE